MAYVGECPVGARALVLSSLLLLCRRHRLPALSAADRIPLYIISGWLWFVPGNEAERGRSRVAANATARVY